MSLPSTISERSLHSLGTHVLARSPGARFPWAGQWELTCRCNLKCVMCYTDCFNTPAQIRQELTTEEVIRILDELQEAGCVELTFTGGEPLARPDFMTIYEAAHRRGFFVTIFTNGTLITPSIADRWAEARPKSVEISLHGLSSAVFDGVTQVPGSLDRCRQGIALLMARRIPVVLKTVGLTMNWTEILAVKRFADSLGPGVTWRFGQYLRNDLAKTGAPFRLQLSENRLEELERQDPQLWEAKCEEIAQSEPSNKPCGGGLVGFHIDAYGQLQLCSNNRRAGYDLRTGSFEQGFYETLPTLPCPARSLPDAAPVRLHVHKNEMRR